MFGTGRKGIQWRFCCTKWNEFARWGNLPRKDNIWVGSLRKRGSRWSSERGKITKSPEETSALLAHPQEIECGGEVRKTVIPWRTLSATLGVFCSKWRGDDSLWRVTQGSPCFRRISFSAAGGRFAQVWAQRKESIVFKGRMLSLPLPSSLPCQSLMVVKVLWLAHC